MTHRVEHPAFAEADRGRFQPRRLTTLEEGDSSQSDSSEHSRNDTDDEDETSMVRGDDDEADSEIGRIENEEKTKEVVNSKDSEGITDETFETPEPVTNDGSLDHKNDMPEDDEVSKTSTSTSSSSSSESSSSSSSSESKNESGEKVKGEDGNMETSPGEDSKLESKQATQKSLSNQETLTTPSDEVDAKGQVQDGEQDNHESGGDDDSVPSSTSSSSPSSSSSSSDSSSTEVPPKTLIGNETTVEGSKASSRVKDDPAHGEEKQAKMREEK